jgi:post-segregation antitoxin (ccd killing protein)
VTKKITFTLEEDLIEKLSDASIYLGKKKTQIIREALKSYLNEQTEEKQRQIWELENKKAIESYNRKIEKHGVFSDTLRSF